MPPVHSFRGFLHSVELQRGKDGWEPNAYPFNLPALKGWDRLALHPHVTFFVGENGSGKSTLVEAIAVALGCNPEGGSKDHMFATRDTHSPLHRFLSLVRPPQRPWDTFFLRAESFYQTSSYLDDEGEGRYTGGAKLHALSHGQSFMALFQHGLRDAGLYILDEPEAALSPSRQLSFLSLLHDLVRAKSQLLIATHSPILLAYPHAKIFELSDRGLNETAYDDLEHVTLTRSFLNRPGTFLKTLLADEGED